MNPERATTDLVAASFRLLSYLLKLKATESVSDVGTCIDGVYISDSICP